MSCVRRYGDLTDHIRSEVALLKDSLQANRQLDLVLLRVLLDNGDNLEGQVDELTDAVCHHVKDTIRRDERNRAVSVKTTKSHALMELDIVNLDALVCRLLCNSARTTSCTRAPHQKLIVQAEFALWHAC